MRANHVTTRVGLTFASLLWFLTGNESFAQDASLAQELSNPIASLISVPFQFNYDQNIGPEEEGERLTLNIQPVIPFSLNDDWNVISRTIVPIISQDDIFPGAGDQFGLGDTVQSLFFSPATPGPSGIIWGVGPVFLLPTGGLSDELLSGEKWGAGPRPWSSSRRADGPMALWQTTSGRLPGMMIVLT
jgi:hypothetical protein